jgi:hypothetical protein
VKFGEIVRRLNGISTPIGGISWQAPAESHTEVARHLFDYLEDRRVLFAPYDREESEDVVGSVLDIRKRLSADIERLDADSELRKTLMAMRAACRQFLDRISPRRGRRAIIAGMQLSPHDYAALIDEPLGELRATFGVCIANIAVRHHLDVPDTLAPIMPAEQTE